MQFPNGVGGATLEIPHVSRGAFLIRLRAPDADQHPDAVARSPHVAPGESGGLASPQTGLKQERCDRAIDPSAGLGARYGLHAAAGAPGLARRDEDGIKAICRDRLCLTAAPAGCLATQAPEDAAYKVVVGGIRLSRIPVRRGDSGASGAERGCGDALGGAVRQVGGYRCRRSRQHDVTAGNCPPRPRRPSVAILALGVVGPRLASTAAASRSSLWPAPTGAPTIRAPPAV